MPRIQGASFQSGCYLFINYEYSQNHAANTTFVAYGFGVHFGDYYFNATNKTLSVTASPGSGSNSWSEAGNRPWPHGGTHQDYLYHSGSFTVNHDVNGNAGVQMYGTFNPSSVGGGGTRTVYGAFALPQIPRGSNPPSAVTLTNKTSTTMDAQFSDGGGGAPIDARELGYGTNSAAPTTTISSDGTTTVTGLTPGTLYYFWARTHNVAGWTAWGPRSQGTTLTTPSAPAAPTISDITMVSAVANYTPPANGGSAITAYQVGYGTSSTGPSVTVSGTSPRPLSPLLPGTRYYVWVRAQNVVGLGPWSAPTIFQTIAGARVKVGPEWKLGVPYVKVAGVWKVARPWTRYAGTWKETS